MDNAGAGVRAAYGRLVGLAERMERSLGRPNGRAAERAGAGDAAGDTRIAAAAGGLAMRRMAHAARQDLTVIKGRAQLLRRRVLAARTPDLVVLRGLDEIDRAVDRLDALITANLDPPPLDEDIGIRR